MTMRLFERERRADSSTGAAWLPTRMTHASNFSEASRPALSEVIGMLSMPNWRKHSESRFLEDSCRSTNAARAENFLLGAKGTREFPKGSPFLRQRDQLRILIGSERRDLSREQSLR